MPKPRPFPQNYSDARAIGMWKQWAFLCYVQNDMNPLFGLRDYTGTFKAKQMSNDPVKFIRIAEVLTTPGLNK